MNKEQQDKLWNELSEVFQRHYREDYLFLCNEHADTSFREGEIKGIKMTMETIFGTHNLNPKPQIKEWKDVPLRMEKCDVKKGDDYFEIALLRSEFSEKLFNKIIATARISKIIELGYGGMVSEEEWKDEDIIKFGVKWSYKANDWVYHTYQTTKHFIAFHTPEQREEFMSHESNRNLVSQYYCI